MTQEPSQKKSFWQNAKEVLYGMASHDMSRYAVRTRASMEHLFILITMGDMIGSPSCHRITACACFRMWSRKSRPGSGACYARKMSPMPCSRSQHHVPQTNL